MTARGSQPTSGFKGDIHRASFGLAHLGLADRSQRCQSVLAQPRIHARNAKFTSERTGEVILHRPGQSVAPVDFPRLSPLRIT